MPDGRGFIDDKIKLIWNMQRVRRRRHRRYVTSTRRVLALRTDALSQRFYMRQVDSSAFVSTDMRAIKVPVIAVDARPYERFSARRQKACQRRSSLEICRAFFVHGRKKSLPTRKLRVEQIKNIWSRKNPMSRRKGELSSFAMDRGWPHQVILPADACTGQNSKIIDEFCADLSLCSRNHSVVKNDEWHLIFCFAEKDHAEKFKARFAGEWFDSATRGRGSRWHLLREPRQKFY